MESLYLCTLLLDFFSLKITFLLNSSKIKNNSEPNCYYLLAVTVSRIRNKGRLINHVAAAGFIDNSAMLSNGNIKIKITIDLPFYFLKKITAPHLCEWRINLVITLNQVFALSCIFIKRQVSNQTFFFFLRHILLLEIAEKMWHRKWLLSSSLFGINVPVFCEVSPAAYHLFCSHP